MTGEVTGKLSFAVRQEGAARGGTGQWQGGFHKAISEGRTLTRRWRVKEFLLQRARLVDSEGSISQDPLFLFLISCKLSGR